MRKVKFAVIGGGITGQLVQYAVPSVEIFDWHPDVRRTRPLTRQYGANYLWEPIPGIPCKAFPVVTCVDGQIATLASVRRYKAKVGKPDDLDEWEMQFNHRTTGYDFESLPTPRVHYNHRVVEIDRINHVITFAHQGPLQYDLLISTVPLYSLLSLLGMPEPPGRLQFKPIFFKVTARPPDAPYPVDTMYVNYISDPAIGPYRYTDRFGERHYESIIPFEGPSTKRYAPGKIYAHPHVPELVEILEGFGIVTFGRFGSWNPDELIHETWHQIVAWGHMLGEEVAE